MPSSPRRVRCRNGQEKTDTSVPPATGRCGHRPLQKNVRFQRRERCPHRPVGYVVRAGGKNGHACTVGFRADVGIGPYEKTCVFSVGGDALIAPWGTSSERSRRTDTPIPSASGPMWASAPTKNGSSPHCRGRCPHRPACQRAGSVRFWWAALSTHLGTMWASSPTKNGSLPHCSGRCPHRPAGYDSRAVRKNGHAHTVGFRADVGHGPLRRNRGGPHQRNVGKARSGFSDSLIPCTGSGTGDVFLTLRDCWTAGSHRGSRPPQWRRRIPESAWRPAGGRGYW